MTRRILFGALAAPLLRAQEEMELLGMLRMNEAVKTIAVYDRPGGVRRDVPWKQAGKLMEYASEEEGFPVLERRGEWFRVAMKSGSAWTRMPAGGKYYELSEMLQNSLSYLKKNWDGRLAKVAGGAMGPKLRTEVEPTVKVVGRQMAEGTVWVNLIVLHASPCEGEEPKPIARGWVPIRQVWYYSRGC